MSTPSPLAIAAAAAIRDGHPAKAQHLLRQAGDPGTAKFVFALGMGLLDAGMALEASILLALAVERAPGQAETWLALGHAFRRREAPKRAIHCYGKAIEVGGETPEALYNLGEALLSLDDHEAARRALMRADELQPSGMAHMALGNLERHLFRYPEAVAHFRRATELLREDASDAGYCHTMLAITALLIGDYATGWAEYEWRLRHAQASLHNQWCGVLPHWDGVLRPGLHLVVHHEQGLGDSLHFVRYCRWLRQHSVTVTLVVQRPLQTLLARQSPPLADTVLVLGDPLPAADAHVSLLSLPAKLLPHWGQMDFMGAPYLAADPLRLAAARRHIAALADGRPAIGVVWAGNPDYPQDRERSLAYEQLAPLLAAPEVAFFSLQLGSQRERLLADPAAPLVDLGGELTDFDATAAFVGALDGLVSVDSAPAHLAGALGRPVATLVARRNDFRWGRPPTVTSPWYPSLVLIRQQEDGAWERELTLAARRLGQGRAFDAPCAEDEL